MMRNNESIHTRTRNTTVNRILTVLFILEPVLAFSCATKKPETSMEKASKTPPMQVTWNIDNLSTIGGYPVTVEGQPKIIDTPKGKAVEFDGIDDGLFINVHPLEGAETFTLEVIFCPYANGPEEQRFFHLQENDSNNRLLIETRIIGGTKWSLDTFMMSGKTDQTLLDKSITHLTDQWYNVALVFDGKEMRHYINGVRELFAPIAEFMPPKAGRTSMGVRINKVYWFRGAIRQARFTRRALEPEKFLKP